MNDSGRVPADRRPHHVAIVGMGPRGLYCLERLVAHFNVAPLHAGLHISVFNRSAHFGASPIYDPGQAEYLLLNMKVGEIDVWGTDGPAVVADRTPDFIAWYARTYPSRAPLTGEEYLARSVVGRYLVESFHAVADRLPAGLSLSCHVGEVVDIEPARGRYVIAVGSGDGGEAVCVDKVMLATGHSWRRPGARARSWGAFARRHPRARFIPFAYPVEDRLSDIAAGTRVAMLGLGLTFIDAALALTEGRGGAFRRDAAGTLVYSPSGREPATILPFSRTGLPMSPKSADLPYAPSRLRFLTPRTLGELRRRAPGGRLDFDRDVLALFELEMELRYYGVALEGDPAWDEIDVAHGTPASVRGAIDGLLQARPQLRRWDYRSFLDPAAGRRFDSPAQFHRFVRAHMDEQIALAVQGQQRSGAKAAIEIWYAVRGALGSVLQYGGFTPQSHRRLVEEVFPPFKRVAFGPPIVNIEKLAALQDAGMIDFSLARGSQVALDEDGACFELRSAMFPGAVASFDALVDARYPDLDLADDATPLLRNLRRRGTIRAFENRSAIPGEPSYRPGAIDMADPTRFVVGRDGVPNADVAVIGIPTEGNLVGNATMERDPFAGRWAEEVIRQFQRVEDERGASRVAADSAAATKLGPPLRTGAMR